MQNSFSFILSKLIIEKSSDRGLTENTISNYKQVVNSLLDRSSECLAINFLAKQHLDNNNLIQAFDAAKEMISKMPDGSETRNNFEHMVISIHMAVKKLGVENSADQQIGPVYRALLDFGQCDLELHYIATQHYLVIGEAELAKELISRMKETAPNYIG